MNERFPLPTPSQEASLATTNPHQESSDKKAEILLNPRIQLLMQARDEAERQLQEAIVDLENRDSESDFKIANDLFTIGWRIGASTDHDGNVTYWLSNKNTGVKIEMDTKDRIPFQKETELIRDYSEVIIKSIGASNISVLKYLNDIDFEDYLNKKSVINE